MKKIIKTIAVSTVILSLFASCATTSNTEKAAAEKPAKAEKTAKADKSQKSEKSAKENKSKTKKMKFDQAAYDEAFAKRDYQTCIAMLNGKNDSANLIKDNLDADMLMYVTEDYQAAGKGFLDTYGQMQQVSSEMKAGDVMKAALVSENSVVYSGAEYERYLAWSMRLASALNTNQTDVANGIMKDYIGTFMDEIQELRAKNKEMEQSSGELLESEDFKKAEKALQLANVDLGIASLIASVPKKSTEDYDYSPFFSYLGTVAYAVNDDFDHAKDFASTYKVNENLVNEVVSVPAGKGRLEVVALSGTIGKRSDASEGKIKEVPMVLSPKPMKTKIAYPEFKPQTHAIKLVRITLSDGSSKGATMIEDFDKAVQIDVAQKARGAAQRSVFRNVVKNSASVAAIVAANEGLKKADANPMLKKTAEVAFNKAVDEATIAVVNTEKADIRQGEYFPNMASSAGFSVAPGTYSVKIEYMDGTSVVETKTIDNVVVKEGKVSVAVSSCEK